MTRIEFFFDPSCPFCWITSRWLLQVEKQRDLEVTWRPFSLAMKNDELEGGERAGHGAAHVAAHRVHRVIAAAAEQGASVIDLYSTFGRAYHVDKRRYDDALIAEVLAGAGLSADLAQAADDTARDQGLADELRAALDIVGEDVGVPLIVFPADDGSRLGYFGPVLNELPGEQEGLDLWDGLEKLATVTSFYELKRSRPDGGPDTQSTKGL